MNNTNDLFIKEYHIILKYPTIFDEIVMELCEIKLDYNKTWTQNDINDLDLIEIILHIENILDSPMSEKALNYFNINNKPINLKSYIRDIKINKLLNLSEN